MEVRPKTGVYFQSMKIELILKELVGVSPVPPCRSSTERLRLHVGLVGSKDDGETIESRQIQRGIAIEISDEWLGMFHFLRQLPSELCLDEYSDLARVQTLCIFRLLI